MKQEIHDKFPLPTAVGEGIQLGDPHHQIAVALIEPEIPGNTGSIARTCVATKTPLIIVGPTPFEINDRQLKRAGLDYWRHLDWQLYPDKEMFLEDYNGRRLVLTSAHASNTVSEFQFQQGDILVFGKETKGLDDYWRNLGFEMVKLPMWGETRSLNLSNTATTVLYESYRQLGFPS